VSSAPAQSSVGRPRYSNCIPIHKHAQQLGARQGSDEIDWVLPETAREASAVRCQTTFKRRPSILLARMPLIRPGLDCQSRTIGHLNQDKKVDSVCGLRTRVTFVRITHSGVIRFRPKQWEPRYYLGTFIILIQRQSREVERG
jgi:hypothetical protein